jgi:signal transduction histidine kinase
MPIDRGRLLVFVALFVLYVAAGRLGLTLDAVSGFATLVWAPTGISLAALVLFGIGLWPAVALGALVVNVWAGAPALVAGGIAAGNTLEAVFAAYALQRIPGFTPTLERLRDVLGIIAWAALLSTAVSASFGAVSLWLAGLVPPDRFTATWLAWWVGDAVADLVVAPLLLTWFAPRVMLVNRERAVEFIFLALALVVTSSILFASDWLGPTVTTLQPYLLSPFLIWAALRFYVRGAASAIFLVSGIAVWGTAAGRGPFIGGPLHERLAALQAFMAILALTFLILGAVARERAEAETRLMVAKDAAEAGSRAKGRFLAVVSHELRTPLNGVIGYAELLLENIGGNLSEQQTVYVDRIKAAASHLRGIIDGILTFAGGEARRDALKLETVDAAALLHEAVALVAPQAARKRLAVVLALPEGPVNVHTDPGKVRQILVNLVDNAVKFTSLGSIGVELRRENRALVFVVSDHGRGIPQDELDHIFEPFTQLPADDSHFTTGPGLGLTVARLLATAVGGRISVISQLGEGSTFTFVLPVDVVTHPRHADTV